MDMDGGTVKVKNERALQTFLKLVTLAALAVGVLVISGCSTSTEPESTQGTDGVVSTFWAKTIDGREIPCVVWQGYSRGGLSCDWEYR